MSWYDPAWKRRAAVTVDNSASGSATFECSIDVDSDWDEFWDNVDADGDDIRFTLADGTTLRNYELVTWDYANRTAEITVDVVVPHANGLTLLWMYWEGTATAASVSVPILTPITGYIEQSAPGPIQIEAARAQPGTQVIDREIAKTSNETIDVWWLLQGRLTKRVHWYNGSLKLEEVRHVSGVVVYQEGSSQASMTTLAQTRFIEHNGQLWIRTRHSGGTAYVSGGADGLYLIVLTVKTDVRNTQGQILEGRALLKVYNPAED